MPIRNQFCKPVRGGFAVLGAFRSHVRPFWSSAGALGQYLRPHLAKRPGGLRSSDIRDPGKALPNEEIMVGDLGDARFVDRMVAGTSAVVHLGAVATEDVVDKMAPTNAYSASA